VLAVAAIFRIATAAAESLSLDVAATGAKLQIGTGAN
jgi:hypothetical protein